MAVTALDVVADALGHPGAPPSLRQLRLRIRPGERVALLGGNGTGKTTLLKAAVGLLPIHGEVRIFGRRVRTPRAAVEAGAALLFQNPSDQLFGATVLEDALYGPLNQGIGAEAARHRALAALERTGMAHLAQRPVEALSFGEKKRAGLAGLLAMEPSLLLLDEPTAGLDPAGELALVEVLRAAAARGATLVVASHAVDLVPRFADRLVLLGEGRVLADGPARALFADEALLARTALRPPWVTSVARALWPAQPTPPLTLEEVLACREPRS
jgi:cobalt/nickel transport system ATP-binding protein